MKLIELITNNTNIMSSKNKKDEKLTAKFSSQPKIKDESTNEPTPIILDESSISDEFFDMSAILGKGKEVKKESLFPYQIHIKNLTDEKLYDVDIFNYEHDKQRKIEYSCTNGVPYERFLRSLSSNCLSEEKVDLFRLMAWCDYAKFQNKQLNCCLHTIYEKPNGNYSSVPTHVGIYFSAYQQQSSIVDVKNDGLKIQLNNELQLRLSYLMPETEITITIFPSKIIM